MGKVKVIDWNLIRAEYVMGHSGNYPTYASLAKQHRVSKPLIISMANDTLDPLNRGFTWIEQREQHISKKQIIQNDVAAEEAKKSIKTMVKSLSGIATRSYRLLNNFFEQLEVEQQRCMAAGEFFDISKYVKIDDINKIASTMNKIAGSDKAGQIVLQINAPNGSTGKAPAKLGDLTDEQVFKLIEDTEKGGTE